MIISWDCYGVGEQVSCNTQNLTLSNYSAMCEIPIYIFKNIIYIVFWTNPYTLYTGRLCKYIGICTYCDSKSLKLFSKQSIVHSIIGQNCEGIQHENANTASSYRVGIQ